MQLAGRSGKFDVHHKDVPGQRSYHTIDYYPAPLDKFRVEYHPPAKGSNNVVEWVPSAHVSCFRLVSEPKTEGAKSK